MLLALTLAEALQMALTPLFWIGIVLWFVGSTAQLRRSRLPWQAWSIWGAVTLAIAYALAIFVLYPRSDFGRHIGIASNPLAVDEITGVVASAIFGAILGAFLYALSPKWPGGTLRPSASS